MNRIERENASSRIARASGQTLDLISKDQERVILCPLRKGNDDDGDDDDNAWNSKERRALFRACEGIAAFDCVEDRDDRARLFEAFVALRYDQGECVVRQGDVGRNFYVIADGTCEVIVLGNESDDDDVVDDKDDDGGENDEYENRCAKIDATKIEKRKEIGAGQTFGEVALLNPNMPIRSASVFAKSKRLTLWAIDSKTFGDILRTTAFQKRAANVATLQNVEVFANALDDYEMSLLADALSDAIIYKKNDVIMKRNDETAAKRMYFLCRGECEVRFSNNNNLNNQQQQRECDEISKSMDSNEKIAMQEQELFTKRLISGSYFGELSLLRGTAPTADVIATSETVKVQWLDRGTFRRFVRAEIVEELEKHAANYRMSPSDVEKVNRKSDENSSPQSSSRKFQSNNSKTATLTEAPETFKNKKSSSRRDAGQKQSAVTSVKSALKSLTRRFRKGSVFSAVSEKASGREVIGEHKNTTTNIMTTNNNNNNASKSTRSIANEIALLAKVTKRKHFTFHKQLGVGMTATVFLAKTVDSSKTTCCVKVMRKKTLRDLDQITNVSRERELLRSFPNNQFVMQAACSFQDDHFAYLVMEHMTGGDLFQLLVKGPFSVAGDKKVLSNGDEIINNNNNNNNNNDDVNVLPSFSADGGGLPLPVAKFYVAEVSCALRFLHDNKYIYRDLKPENVLIDCHGHCKLCDLGFTKKIEPSERCYTTCGTADYMAPEVTLRKGYTIAVDVWAVGVLLYELLTGKAPFAAKTDGERHQRITKGDVRFPKTFNLAAKDIVSKLLVIDPSKRMTFETKNHLNNTNEYASSFENHAFWAPLDWEEVKGKNMEPPYRPRTRSEKELFRKHPPLRDNSVEGLKPYANAQKFSIVNF
jgi:serine/threonine protein kinase/CRP-like cAMP-binding protein